MVQTYSIVVFTRRLAAVLLSSYCVHQSSFIVHCFNHFKIFLFLIFSLCL